MNYEIIDAHAHIFPEKIAENATASTGKFYDLHMDNVGISQKLIEAGETIGVSRYLVCSAATVPHQVGSINSFIARECEKNPCFFGFGTTHPHSENIEADVEQVRALGLHGIKLHPDFQEFDADSPEAFRIYEIMEGELPLLIHCGDPRYNWSAPEKIRRICENFPKLELQAAHLGGYQRWSEAEELLAGFENVRFDISSSLAFMSSEDAVRRIRKFGIEKCFFGCDFPMWNHREELQRFLALGFSDEENHLILAQNFKNFYKI
ncbi:MAG: amidohydrolase family protein [Ruminococcus flavefaciens]|nr:amidohydrolase family protein [Ruminococcus flavefaciens]MCM1232811.1 amidohydrolase family protein [Ruminococcus flavefaciens]